MEIEGGSWVIIESRICARESIILEQTSKTFFGASFCVLTKALRTLGFFLKTFFDTCVPVGIDIPLHTML
jgi:GT2 family glycosyltransferase